MSPHEEISRLIALASQLLDDQRYDDWVGLLTDDGLLGVGGAVHRGRHDIRSFVASIQPTPPGKHFTGLPVIDVADAATAYAWTDMVMLLPNPPSAVRATAMCRYHDVLDRSAGRWLFAARYLQFPGEPLQPGAPPTPPA